jgi:CysZ protein
MEGIAAALWRGSVSLVHPRMLWLMVWPILAALAIWVTLAALYWEHAAKWIDLHLHQLAFYDWAVSTWPMTLVAAWFGGLLLLLMLVPIVLVTAVLIISVVSMPTMVAHVAKREYPTLESKKGGTVTGSLWNALAALTLFVLLFAVTLPLWLFPLLWPVLPVLLFGYFNQRVFRYDALAEHASAGEIQEVIRRSRGELFALGVALALIGYLPLFGLVMPLYGGLVFIHYALARLGELRGEPIESSARRL